MLDLFGAVVGMAAIAINLVAMGSVLTDRLPARLALAAVAGAWVGLASGLGAAGSLAFSPGQPIPVIGVLFATPLLVVGVLAFVYPGVRAALVTVPMSLLIGLNGIRILGGLFLMLAAVGRLSGPFPYSAGIGDIITGIVAIPLALRVARALQRGEQAPLGGVMSWNFFGILDLVAAVTLGITSTPGSPLQLIHAGVGSQAIQYLPYALVPTVLVPYYLITHATIVAQVRAQRAAVAAAHA